MSLGFFYKGFPLRGRLSYTNTTCTSVIYSAVPAATLNSVFFFHRCSATTAAQAMSSGRPWGRAEKINAAQAVDHQHRHDGAGQHTREVDNKPWCGPPAAEHHKGQKPYQRRHARDHRHKQRTVYIKRHGRPPFSR
mgnify:CR=1 FL=1